MLETITAALDGLLASFIEQPQASPLTSLALYLAAGLASSLFPCYYPLIPITAGFLRRRSQASFAGSQRNGSPVTAKKNDPVWLHPLVYWLGSVLLYLLFGLVAASGGKALSVIMQNGWVILTFGLAFLYLTMAMLDLVPLGLEGARTLVDRAASRRGLIFTLLMGMAAGMAASACVSPALVTILLFIAKQSSSGGSVAYGMALAAAYGAGLGIPLFLSGVLGAKLPQSGRWMNPVKYAFAALIYIAAFLQLEKGFIVLGVLPEHAFLLLLYFTGFSLLFLFALPRIFRAKMLSGQVDPVRFRILQAGSIFALLFIFSLPFLIVRKERHASDAALLGKTEQVGALVFYRHPDEAFAKAQEEDRPIFIDFYADWCSNCKDFSRLLETDEMLAAGINEAVLLKIYDTDPAFDRFAETYPELNIGLPFFLVLRPDRTPLYRSTNYRDSTGMIRAIRSYKEVAR
jgi:thiol:disulfide interchange protein DsbD